MTSVWGRKHPRRERPSVVLSVAPSITPPDSFPPPESGNKLSNQPAGPSGTKPSVADALTTATSVPKYSENDLQRIFKAVLEAQAPTAVLIDVVAEVLREKLKAYFPDV